MAMAVLVSALEVGSSPVKLAQHTGYALELTQVIAHRMEEAKLWNSDNDSVDDRELWDESGDLHYSAMYTQALVALGYLCRRCTGTEAIYVDTRTGEIVARSHAVRPNQ
jgi:hypothetical protein